MASLMVSRRWQCQLLMGAILWLGLLTRLVYLDYINQPPPDTGLLFAPLCGVDAHIYDQYGRDMLQGAWPGTTPLFRTPLYSLYLGIHYGLFGFNHYTPLIVQTLIHTVAVAALYKMSSLAFSRATGRLAALGYICYGPLVFYTGCFAPISLVLPLLIVALFLALKFGCSLHSRRYLVTAGLLLGLAGLGRPTVLALLPAFVLFLATHRAGLKRWAWQSILLTGAVLLPILPVSYFNYHVSGRFVPISTNGPEVLFISNNPDAEGRDILAPGIAQPVHRRMEQVVAAIARGETTFTRQVVNYIRSEPLDWLALELNKLKLLFFKSDLNLLTVAFSYPTTARQLTVFQIPLQWHGLLLAALLGLVFIQRRAAWLLFFYIIFMMLAIILFFVQLRFRMLLLPAILPYAAALLAFAPRWLVQNQFKFWGSLLILILATPFFAGT